MEDTHGAKSLETNPKALVLILIIMEDTHGVQVGNAYKLVGLVLILIIMEDTHGDEMCLLSQKSRS